MLRPTTRAQQRRVLLLILGLFVVTVGVLAVARPRRLRPVQCAETEAAGPASQPPFPIDFVFTWAGENTASSNIRNAYLGELQYSLRGVVMFAPWVRRIHVLMNPPRRPPSWFNHKYGRLIRLHTTADVYPEPQARYLPCTNSNSIETVLHRIPGLSEHFVYSNDDFFLCRPLPYTAFFTPRGQLKLPASVAAAQPMEDPAAASVALRAGAPAPLPRMHGGGAMHGGFFPHVPVPMRRSAVEAFQAAHPAYVEWVRRKRSRTGIGCSQCFRAGLRCPCQQQHYPVAMFAYFSLGMAVLDRRPPSHVYINSRTMHLISDPKFDPPHLLCLNNSDNIDLESQRQHMLAFFRRHFTHKPFYEK